MSFPDTQPIQPDEWLDSDDVLDEPLSVDVELPSDEKEPVVPSVPRHVIHDDASRKAWEDASKKRWEPHVQNWRLQYTLQTTGSNVTAMDLRATEASKIPMPDATLGTEAQHKQSSSSSPSTVGKDGSKIGGPGSLTRSNQQ